MRGLGTDQVISGPMRGFEEKNASNGAITQMDMATLWLNRPSGVDSVKIPHTWDTESLNVCGY